MRLTSVECAARIEPSIPVHVGARPIGPGPEPLMSDRILSLGSDDDLPRSFRREREARERASRAPQHQTWPDTPQPAVVTALKIPFFRLMFFFLKAVIAAI